MRTLAFAMLFAGLLASGATAQTTEIEMPADTAIYGEYPKNFKEIVLQWLSTQLVDAPSANVEWIGAPKPSSLPTTKDGQRVFGYLVEFKVNSRNRFGAYTGMQRHGALIRDGKVVRGTGFGY